jgi:hypothetical protein
MKTKNKKQVEFGTREHMLETLHLSYQYALDNLGAAMFGNLDQQRLNGAKQKELGKSLSKYWNIK